MKGGVFIVIDDLCFGENLARIVEPVVGGGEAFQVTGNSVGFPQFRSTCDDCGEFAEGTNKVAFALVGEECEVLPKADSVDNDEDAALHSARLALCAATRQTLDNGLQLLGVTAPERM